jgi:hypothetical protein
MPIEPEHPTEKYCLGRILFHETQTVWFNQHDQVSLAAWSQKQVDKWRKKLEALKAKEETPK